MKPLFIYQYWLIHSDEETRNKFNLQSHELENIIDQVSQEDCTSNDH